MKNMKKERNRLWSLALTVRSLSLMAALTGCSGSKRREKEIEQKSKDEDK